MGLRQQLLKFTLIRLGEIAEAVDVPLVLDGGTGIGGEDIQKAITMGDAKLNVGTIVHTTYMKELYKEIGKDINAAYPPYLMKDVIPRIKDVVIDRLNAVNFF